MSYTAALIGCGNIGSLFADDPLVKGIYTHAAAYDACPDTKLIAVCDSDQYKAKSCAERWNIDNFYTNLDALLIAHSPDIVSICTPDKTHASILEQVLKAPNTKAVLVEKPIALNEEEAMALIELASQRNIVLAVNYSRRYSPAHAEVKTKVQLGELGRLQSISGFYTKGLLHNGTHWLDLARWYLGDVAYLQGQLSATEISDNASFSAQLIFKCGAVGFLHALDADAFSLFEMDIVGTKGRIRLVDSGHRIEYFTVTASPYYSGYQTVQKVQEVAGELDDTLLHAVMDLVDCLKNQKTPKCSGIDGLAAIQLATSIIHSTRTGQMIPFNRGHA